MSSREVIRQKIADVRAKETISWAGVLIGLILLTVGIALAFHRERSLWTGGTSQPYQTPGLIIAVVGFFIIVGAGGTISDYSKEKSEYLKELESLEMSKDVCPKCGKKMSPDFKLCPYCGEKLVA